RTRELRLRSAPFNRVHARTTTVPRLLHLTSIDRSGRKSTPLLPSLPERAHLLHQAGDHLGLVAQIRIARHGAALSDRGATLQDHLLDLLVGDGFLPLGVGERARFRVERGCAGPVAFAFHAVTDLTALAI